MDDDEDISAATLSEIERELTRLLGARGIATASAARRAFEKLAARGAARYPVVRARPHYRIELACRLIQAEEAWIADEEARQGQHGKRTGIHPRKLQSLKKSVSRIDDEAHRMLEIADEIALVNLSRGATIRRDADTLDLPDELRRWVSEGDRVTDLAKRWREAVGPHGKGRGAFNTFPWAAARFMNWIRRLNGDRQRPGPGEPLTVARIFATFMNADGRFEPAAGSDAAVKAIASSLRQLEEPLLRDAREPFQE